MLVMVRGWEGGDEGDGPGNHYGGETGHEGGCGGGERGGAEVGARDSGRVLFAAVTVKFLELFPQAVGVLSAKVPR